MDLHIVALEVSDLIAHFDYYNNLVTGGDEQAKLRSKNQEHLAKYFADIEFYNAARQLRPLYETKDAIIAKLEGMKAGDIHDLVEKLEKDAKKMKKLYKALTKEK